MRGRMMRMKFRVNPGCIHDAAIHPPVNVPSSHVHASIHEISPEVSERRKLLSNVFLIFFLLVLLAITVLLHQPLLPLCFLIRFLFLLILLFLRLLVPPTVFGNKRNPCAPLHKRYLLAFRHRGNSFCILSQQKPFCIPQQREPLCIPQQKESFCIPPQRESFCIPPQREALLYSTTKRILLYSATKGTLLNSATNGILLYSAT